MPKGDLEGLRSYFGTLKTQFASAANVFEGPLKGLYDELCGKLDSTLAALPTDTQAGADIAAQAEHVFGLLTSATACASSLGLELTRVRQQLAGAGAEAISAALASGDVFKKDQLAGLITEAITARTGENGDLMTRELCNQLCSAARLEGEKAGREAVLSEQAAQAAQDAQVATRKEAIQAAGVALPPESVAAILRSSDEDYAKALDLARSRTQGYQEAGLTLTPELLGNVWLSEGEFKVFDATVKSIGAIKRVEPKSAAHQALAGTPGGGSDNNGKTKIVV